MAVDRNKAIQALSKIKVRGNNEGMIPAFGVLVQFLPTNFWNTFSEQLLKLGGEERYSEIEAGLIRAAAECGYHTGWGIINSEEFKSIVGPMIEKQPEDVLHGAYAVFTAWGWANSEIVELIPGKRKVVRAYQYYESEIYDTFKVQKPCAYMIQGVAAAFMDIAYGQTYPNGLNTFKCQQTKGIEVGDEYGEFVVTPR